MPKVITTKAVKVGYKTYPFTRPICDFTARRIERLLPAFLALNNARKSQADAAEVLGVTVMTVRNYCKLLDVRWINLKERGKYAPRSL